jgi:hypothetical protein
MEVFNVLTKDKRKRTTERHQGKQKFYLEGFVQFA